MVRRSVCALAVSAAAGLMLACGGSDLTLYESEGALFDEAGAPEEALGPVRAQLSVEDGDLVISLQNRANYDATIGLGVSVDSPSVHSVNDLGEVRVLAGEERREVISRDRIDAFDLAGSSWLRAELRYRFELDDGQAGVLFTALAARDGAILPKAEAIEAGAQLADRVLEGESTTEKVLGAPFKVCFKNFLQFDPTGGAPSDGLSPNLAADSGSWPFYGQVVYAYYPANGTSFTVKELDTSGCVTLARRKSSGSEDWSFRMLSYGGVPTSGFHAVAYAIDSAGNVPSLVKTVTIPATTNPPSTVSVEFTATEARNLYTATFLAVNTLRRVTSQLGLSPASGYILRISPSTDTVRPEGSFYCPGTNSRCPTAMTLRVGNGEAARDRYTIAHETGHYVHHWYTSFSHSYSYTREDSELPLDGCDFRREPLGHNPFSIEWQSAAHKEGLADFFQAVTYNKITQSAQSDCSFKADGVFIDCEAIGKTLFGNGGSTLCEEWTSSAFFGRTGNELDWTKMYWDFVTNHGGNFAKYMQAEKNVGVSLPTTGGHYGPLRTELTRLDAAQGQKFFDATWGNIFDGNLQ